MMTKTKTTAVLIGLIVMASMARAQTPSTTTVEAEIRDVEQKYNAAYAVNDLATYFGYLAPDFAQWSSGRSTKAEYQASWTKFITSGGKVLAADISELQVSVGPSGDSAVASYLLRVKTQSAKGTVSDETYQETDVLFKRDGAWKVVYLHYSPAPKKPTP